MFDNKKLITGSADKTVRIFDVESGNLKETFQEHRDSVRFVVGSPSSRVHTIYIELHINPIHFNRTLKFDDERLYTAGFDYAMKIWTLV